LDYSVEFVRLPPEEMQGIGLVVLHRADPRTWLYCRADHISAELAQSLSEQGSRYSQTTIRHSDPVSPRMPIRFQQVGRSEMPDAVSPIVACVRQAGAGVYYREGDLTEAMARALELICSEETRYFVRLPVIAPAVPDTPVQ
jgi:hypothetical protein